MRRPGVADTVGSVAFGNVHVGAANSQNLAINNTSTASGATNVEIRGTVSQSGPAFGLASPNFAVAPEATANVAVDWTPTVAGALSQSLTVVRNFSNLANQTAAVTGAACNYAAANTLASPVAFGNVHQGDVVSSALSVTDTAPAGAYTEKLDSSFGAASGSATDNGGTISLLAAGSTDSNAMSVGLNTSAVGSKTGSVAVNFTSDGTGTSGLGSTPLTTQSVSVTSAVYGYAATSLSPNPVTFANVHVGTTESQALSISNTAANDGYHEGLDASFGSTVGAASANGGSIVNLAAGGQTAARCRSASTRAQRATRPARWR